MTKKQKEIQEEQATKRFTEKEAKALNFILSHLTEEQKNLQGKDRDFVKVKINKKDFFNHMGFTGKEKFEVYYHILDYVIRKSYVEIAYDRGMCGGNVICSVHWGNEKQDYFEVKIGCIYFDIIDMLSTLPDESARLNFVQLLSIHSPYTFPVYRWIYSWKNDKKIEIPINNLKKILCLNKNKYSFRGYFMRDNFEKGILETIKTELKEITGIEIEYQAYKNGPKDWIYEFWLN